MSGINLNVLRNTSVPVSSQNSPTEVDLITTTGSRWVLINFLNAIPTSSNGSCSEITLEWSTDPSMVTNPFQPSSSYYAITSSQFSCASASLSPLTGSKAWFQFIDSYWLPTFVSPPGPPTEYYLRAKQRRSTSPVEIYSPVVAVQTRARVNCGVPNNGGEIGPILVADMDSWNSPSFSNVWVDDANSANTAAYTTGSFTITPSVVKAGGPNFDALLFNSSSTLSWPKLSLFGPNGGDITSARIRSGVGIVTGSVTYEFTGTKQSNPGAGVYTYLVTINADASCNSGSIVVRNQNLGTIVSSIEPVHYGMDLRNRLIEINCKNQFSADILVDNNAIGTVNLTSADNGMSLPNNFRLSTPNTAIIRAVIANTSNSSSYDPSVYHCKYGPVGAASYVG